MSRARAALERYLPRGGKRRAIARLERGGAARDAGLRRSSAADRDASRVVHEPGPPSYRRWCRTHDATTEELADQRMLSQSTRDPVTVHCVVTAHGSWGGVRATLESLRQQSWSHWRATVVGGGAGWARSDARVTHRRGDGADPTALVNEALADPDQRSLVLFLEAGDKLAPDACFRIADTVETDPLIDLVYWDDDLVVAGPARRPAVPPVVVARDAPRCELPRPVVRDPAAPRRRDRRPAPTGSATTPGGTCSCAPTSRGERVARIPRVLDAPPPPARRHRAARHRRRRVAPRAHRSSRDAHVSTQRLRAHRVGPARVAARHVGHADAPQPRPAHPVAPGHRPRPTTRRSTSIVVDNGGRTDERVAWYAETFPDLAARGRVVGRRLQLLGGQQRSGAARARGDVLVFVNDDTELPRPRLAARAGRLGDCNPTSASSGLQLLDARRDDPARRRDPRPQRLRRPPLPGPRARTRRR